MAKKKTLYVILTRDGDSDGVYTFWGIKEKPTLDSDDMWQGIHEVGLMDDEFCPTLWVKYTNLRLKPCTKRRVKITFLTNGGCSWKWAGKAK